MSLGSSPLRPVRPVERQPMREWILDRLDQQMFPGLLEWSNKNSGEFRIKWNHGSRQSWSEKDAVVFVKWAEHTGRRDANHDFKKMKANFRCALNSLKDVREVKEKSVCKGGQAFKVYAMKCLRGNANRRWPDRRTKKVLTRKVEVEEASPERMYEDISEEDEATQDIASDSDTELRRADDDRVSFGLTNDTTHEKKMACLPQHMSGFTLEVLKKPEALSPAVPCFTAVPTCILQPQIVSTPSDRLTPSQQFNLPETPESSDASLHSEQYNEEMVELNVLEITLTDDGQTEVEGQSGLITVLSPGNQQLSWQPFGL